MASTASTSLNLELQTQGENDGTWGDKQKTNMTIIDAAIAGRTTVSLNGADATLADVDYTLDAAKYAVLYTSDADQDNRAIVIPNAPRVYRIINASAYEVDVETASPSTNVSVTAASAVTVHCDGSNNVVFVSPMTNYTTGAPNTASGAAASAVSVTPTGDLTSTDAQAAFAELQGDIDAIEADIIANYQPLDTDLTQIAALARAKGALLAGSASAWSILSPGTNNYTLIADSAQTSGIKWGLAPLAGGGTGAALSDPGADAIMGWDDSAGATIFYTIGTGLGTSTTTLGLSHLGIESLTDPGADAMLAWDDSAGATAFMTIGDGLETSDTTLQANIATQAEMESASSTSTLASPGGLLYHPGVAKWRAYITVSAGTPSLSSNYGVSSVTDVDSGYVTVNTSRTFSASNHTVVFSCLEAGVGGTSNRSQILESISTTAAQLHWKTGSSGGSDPDAWYAAGFGDI